MKPETRIMAIVLSVFLIVLIICMSLLFRSIAEDQEEFKVERAKCELLDECEMYACMADMSTTVNHQRNWLMKEQNCLLRENGK